MNKFNKIPNVIIDKINSFDEYQKDQFDMMKKYFYKHTYDSKMYYEIENSIIDCNNKMISLKNHLKEKLDSNSIYNMIKNSATLYTEKLNIEGMVRVKKPIVARIPLPGCTPPIISVNPGVFSINYRNYSLES